MSNECLDLHSCQYNALRESISAGAPLSNLYRKKGSSWKLLLETVSGVQQSFLGYHSLLNGKLVMIQGSKFMFTSKRVWSTGCIALPLQYLTVVFSEMIKESHVSVNWCSFVAWFPQHESRGVLTRFFTSLNILFKQLKTGKGIFFPENSDMRANSETMQSHLKSNSVKWMVTILELKGFLSFYTIMNLEHRKVAFCSSLTLICMIFLIVEKRIYVWFTRFGNYKRIVKQSSLHLFEAPELSSYSFADIAFRFPYWNLHFWTSLKKKVELPF